MKKIVVVAFLSLLMSSAGKSVEAQSGTVETFADWCENQENLNEGEKHTVEVLLRRAGTEECDAAEEALTQRTHLRLAGQQINDARPLASLTNLTWLHLGENQIKDTTPLANLTNLTELNLAWNDVEDVTPLANLTNLTWLNLGWNYVEDATPLCRLRNLRNLYLNGNSSDIVYC